MTLSSDPGRRIETQIRPAPRTAAPKMVAFNIRTVRSIGRRSSGSPMIDCRCRCLPTTVPWRHVNRRGGRPLRSATVCRASIIACTLSSVMTELGGAGRAGSTTSPGSADEGDGKGAGNRLRSFAANASACSSNRRLTNPRVSKAAPPDAAIASADPLQLSGSMIHAAPNEYKIPPANAAAIVDPMSHGR